MSSFQVNPPSSQPSDYTTNYYACSPRRHFGSPGACLSVDKGLGVHAIHCLHEIISFASKLGGS